MQVRTFYWEDVIGGLITSVVGTVLVAWFQRYMAPGAGEYLLLAAILFFIFQAIKFFTRYLAFVLSGRRKACGLFVETYIAADAAGKNFVVLAPFVAYFDVQKDTLAIIGHAFELTSKTGAKARAHADWNSLALYQKSDNQDAFSIFYLHDGHLVGAVRDDVPGTSYVRLAKQPMQRALGGYFSDFIEVNRSLDDEERDANPHFKVTYFEVLRASDQMRREFSKLIHGAVGRLKFNLMLGSGNVDAFAQFINNHGLALISQADFDGGPIIREAKQRLKVPRA